MVSTGPHSVFFDIYAGRSRTTDCSKTHWPDSGVFEIMFRNFQGGYTTTDSFSNRHQVHSGDDLSPRLGLPDCKCSRRSGPLLAITRMQSLRRAWRPLSDIDGPVQRCVVADFGAASVTSNSTEKQRSTNVRLLSTQPKHRACTRGSSEI